MNWTRLSGDAFLAPSHYCYRIIVWQNGYCTSKLWQPTGSLVLIIEKSSSNRKSLFYIGWRNACPLYVDEGFPNRTKDQHFIVMTDQKEWRNCPRTPKNRQNETWWTGKGIGLWHTRGNARDKCQPPWGKSLCSEIIQVFCKTYFILLIYMNWRHFPTHVITLV